jgi:dihydrofolate reductase
MRKIVYSLTASLDGFFEGPDREIDWHRVDDELHQHMNDLYRDVSAFLTGRITHELMTRAWPPVAADPDASAAMADFAAIWCAKPKHVFSTTWQDTTWNTTIHREVDVEEIRRLQREPGEYMSVGGPDLARTFRELDLIDEYRVYTYPVLIGRGRPMFPPVDARADLRLVDLHRFGNGVTLQRYAR